MARSTSTLLGGCFASIAALALVGCGARTVMEMGSYQDDGIAQNDGGTDTGVDGPHDGPVDGPVYDHINDINGCNPSTCGGCCDQDGDCVAGMEANACGIGGFACVNCSQYNAGCNAGTHQCGPSQECSPANCPKGCCNTDGQCMSGWDSWACGSGGYACTNCQATGTYCDPYNQYCTGQPTCGPDNCSGCCTTWGTCEWGGDSSACGVGGQMCNDCYAQGAQCDPYSYQCTSVQNCGPSTCPNGCCDPYSGSCYAGFDPWSCGTGGQVCQNCTDANQQCLASASGGGICQPTTPDCGPYNCPGCCDCSYGACKCLPGMDSWACGYGGQVCQYCADPNTACEATWGGGGQCLLQQQDCGPDNCQGCCDYSTWPPQCAWGGDYWACGSQGAACSYCDSASCELSPWGGGQCTATTDCGPWNCAGCCDDNTYPPQCTWGGDPWACGANGDVCYACGAGSTCESSPYGGGYCMGYPDAGVDCGPWNCAGCCNNNTYPPYCDTGTLPWACGTQGQQCTACPPNAQCFATPGGGGTCTVMPDAGVDAPPPPVDAGGCGPWNCQGCCTGNGTCVPGQSNNRCGAGGAQCVNCNTTGGTCSGGQCVYANTCPAPYGGCPSYQTVTPPYTKPSACDQAILDKVAVVCSGPSPAPDCGQLLLALQQSNPTCGQCLWQFTGPSAAATCVAPYLSDTCNHATACTFDCLDVACSQCPDPEEPQCRDAALTNNGTCSGYTQGLFCYQSALQGEGAFCAWNGDYGKWLYTVGNHYCGNGTP